MSKSEAKKRARDKDGARLVETGGQHTFPTQLSEWTLVMRTRGRKGGRETERWRKKVGYHSGSRLLEIAAPMPLLPSTCLPPLSTSAQVYLAPNSRALQHRGKSGTRLSYRVNKTFFFFCVCVSQSFSISAFV